MTEIVTGLAMLGYRELDHALGVRPRLVSNVTEEHFDRLTEAREADRYGEEFETAWANGQRFAYSEEGLRGRPPWFLEWKGPHRPPSYEQIPADLRIDHVYLISCKYGSDILMNASPSHLFERLLADRRSSGANDWYATIAPAAYQELWAACRRAIADSSSAPAPGGEAPPTAGPEPALDSLPELATDVTPADRKAMKNFLRPRAWPSDEAAEAYRWLAVDVSNQSAKRWKEQLDKDPEDMLWRLLRFAPSPYFVLGRSSDGRPLHYRVATPWDFRERFELKAFDAWGDAVGQPLVRWRAEIRSTATGELASVDGHVEVRWSHGRFGGMPEAKIYLDTPHHRVPGYFVLK
ncbi:MAG: hypothetical protein ACR2QK_24345 [Acidimicrobiales bacterium]